MRKVDSDEFFAELFRKASFVRRYTKDALYDMHTIRELEREECEYHLEIFYREYGTWMINHMTETPDADYLKKLHEANIFSVEYRKQKAEYGFEYYISDIKKYRP